MLLPLRPLPRRRLLSGLLAAAALPALAQPTVSSLSPAAGTRNAAAAAPVTATFGQPLGAGSSAALKVFGMQRGGQRAGRTGAVSVNGAQLSFAPTYSWHAGETVRATLTTAARDAAGQALARPQVWQFTAAATGGVAAYNFGSLVTTGATTWYGLAAADFDNDGYVDFATTGATGILVALNDGRGAFGNGSGIARSADQLVAGDVDADGDLDLVQTGAVHLNSGNGTFPTTMSFSGAADGLAPLADLDGDGDLDVVMLNAGNGTVGVFLNDGLGRMSYALTLTPPLLVGYDLTVGDVDADGDVDIVTVGGASAAIGKLNLFRNNGNATFVAATTTDVGGNNPTKVVLADVNGDNALDALVGYSIVGDVTVLLNNGSGAFTAGSRSSRGGSIVNSLTVGDVDADGDLDLITNVSGAGTPPVELRLNDGTGTFTTPTPLPGVGLALQMVLADLDNDGDLDLLAPQTSQVTVHLNAGSLTTATARPRTAAPLRVYPNPAHDLVRVELPAGLRPPTATLRLRNALGQVMRSGPLAAPTSPVEVPVLGLPPGVYTLELQTDQALHTQRLLVQ